MNDNSRVYWIDSAKGIGVILIVIGHLLYDSSHELLIKLIYSFHVPLFFIVSGFVYCINDVSKKQFVIKKLRRLIIPFICFSLVAGKRFIEAIYGGAVIKDLLCQIFYVDGKIFFNDPLWFLIVMFEVQIIETFLDPSKRSIKFHLVYATLIYLCGYRGYTLKYMRFMNYFGFNRLMICLFFFEIGYIVNTIHFPKKHPQRADLIQITLCIMLLSFWYVLAGRVNGKISIYQMILSNYHVFILAALIGTAAILMICYYFLDKENVLFKLNKYAVLILGIQYYIIIPFREFAQKKEITKTNIYDFCMVVIAIIVLLVVPLIYSFFSERIKVLKALNGEL